MIRVLVVDDHSLVRHGICLTLKVYPDIEVIGEACSGEEAVEQVRELRPDVVLMDVYMPGIGGLGAIRTLCSREEPARVIALSACEEGLLPEKILLAGAQGYLTKGTPPDEMARAIRRVMNGQRYICHEVSSRLVDSHLDPQRRKRFDELSERELQTVMLVIQGFSVAAIADRMFVSAKTVHTYRSRAFEKLDIKNDVELTLLALREGLIDMKLDEA